MDIAKQEGAKVHFAKQLIKDKERLKITRQPSSSSLGDWSKCHPVVLMVVISVGSGDRCFSRLDRRRCPSRWILSLAQRLLLDGLVQVHLFI